MKNLLKNKKVAFGTGVILSLGLIYYYYEKGKKVLNSTSKNSYNSADGSLMVADGQRVSLLNAGVSSFGNVGSPNNGIKDSALTFEYVGSPKLGDSALNIGYLGLGENNNKTKLDALATSLLQYRELQSGQSSNAVATPIVTNQGIIVKPSGDLQPVGISGFFTTLQAGFTGAPSVALINDIKTKTQAIVQSKEENLKK
jgi:hypothetical protein